MTKRFTLQANVYGLVQLGTALSLLPLVFGLFYVSPQTNPISDFVESWGVGALIVLSGLGVPSLWALMDAFGTKNRIYIRDAFRSLLLVIVGFVAAFMMMVEIGVKIHGSFP